MTPEGTSRRPDDQAGVEPTGQSAASVRLEVLGRAAQRLHQIGSANDAEDHGYTDDARRMRTEACAALRTLLEDHPFLRELLPGLAGELDTGRILGAGWSTLLDAVETQQAALSR